MSDTQDDKFWYPSVDDVLALHEDIIAEDPDATSGIEEEARIEFALSHIQHGHYGEGPETIHEKAFHLMRLLASNHWFADGNKRTSLNTTALFYAVNGYEFDYGEDIRSMLKLLSVREQLINVDEAVTYFADICEPAPETESDPFEDSLIILVGLFLASRDINLDELSDYQLIRILEELEGEQSNGLVDDK